MRICKICREYGIKEPDFNEISNGFQVVLYNEKIIEIGTVEKILDIITNSPQITQAELVEATGLTRCVVEWNLSKLKSKGIIERIGADKGGYWKVK